MTTAAPRELTVRRALEVGALAGGLAVVGFLCWRFGIANLRAALNHFSPRYVGFYLATGCIVRLGYALRWYGVARTFGRSPRLWRLLTARIAGDAVGSLLPIGRISGDPLRMLLAREERSDVVRASASVAIDRIMETTANLLCGVTYLLVFSSAHAFGSSRSAVHLLIGTMLLMLAALMVPLALLRHGIHLAAPVDRFVRGSRLDGLQRWLGAFRRTEDQLIHFLRFHPASMALGILGSLWIEALIVLEYYLLLATFGVTLDLQLLLMTLVATGVAQIVPTPAGLGALEASQVAFFAVASGRPVLGFVIGIVIRLHETLWAVFGLLLLSMRGISFRRLLASNKEVVAR